MPKTARITIRCSPEEYESYQKAAAKIGLSMSDWARLILNKGVNRRLILTKEK